MILSPYYLWLLHFWSPVQNMTSTHLLFITATYFFFHILFISSKKPAYFWFISFIFFIFSSQIFVIISLWGSAQFSFSFVFSGLTPYKTWHNPPLFMTPVRINRDITPNKPWPLPALNDTPYFPWIGFQSLFYLHFSPSVYPEQVL